MVVVREVGRFCSVERRYITVWRCCIQRYGLGGVNINAVGFAIQFRWESECSVLGIFVIFELEGERKGRGGGGGRGGVPVIRSNWNCIR